MKLKDGQTVNLNVDDMILSANLKSETMPELFERIMKSLKKRGSRLGNAQNAQV